MVLQEEASSETNPGRLYIGVMGQYHTPVTSLVQTSAALSQSVIDVELGNERRTVIGPRLFFITAAGNWVRQ